MPEQCALQRLVLPLRKLEEALGGAGAERVARRHRHGADRTPTGQEKAAAVDSQSLGGVAKRPVNRSAPHCAFQEAGGRTAAHCVPRATDPLDNCR